MAYWLDIWRFNESNEYEYKWAGNYGAKGEKRAEKIKPSEEQIEIQNLLNKATRIRRQIKANFMENDLWVTLTYERGTRKSMEEVKKDFKNFMDKMKYRYKKCGVELKWMRVIEIGSRGGIHVHLLINRIRGMPVDTDVLICRCWGHGNPDFRNLYAAGGYEQLAAYMAKIPDEEEREKEEKPRKYTKDEYSYSTSRNLIRPLPERKNRSRWTLRKLLQEGIKPNKGYYIEKSSMKQGINKYTGYSYLKYTEVKLDRRI